jgi:hypothetical protein
MGVLIMAPLCNCSLLFLCALSLHIQTSHDGQFAICRCWVCTGIGGFGDQDCQMHQRRFHHATVLRPSITECTAYILIWNMFSVLLKDISHWDVLGKMMSKELLTDLDANTWSLSLSRWAKWGENSMAVASAIETILILSWVCGRNHVVGLS